MENRNEIIKRIEALDERRFSALESALELFENAPNNTAKHDVQITAEPENHPEKLDEAAQAWEAWYTKRGLAKVDVPLHYQTTLGDYQTLCDYLQPVQRNRVFSAFDSLFDLGFKRGVNYQKNKVKKSKQAKKETA